MTRITRVLVLALGAVVALTLAGNAYAAYKPTLTASTNGPKTTVRVFGSPRDLGSAHILILVPNQYRAVVTLPTATAMLTARIAAPGRNLGASACTASQPPVPCVGATVAGFSGTSNKVVVRT